MAITITHERTPPPSKNERRWGEPIRSETLTGFAATAGHLAVVKSISRQVHRIQDFMAHADFDGREGQEFVCTEISENRYIMRNDPTLLPENDFVIPLFSRSPFATHCIVTIMAQITNEIMVPTDATYDGPGYTENYGEIKVWLVDGPDVPTQANKIIDGGDLVIPGVLISTQNGAIDGGFAGWRGGDYVSQNGNVVSTGSRATAEFAIRHIRCTQPIGGLGPGSYPTLQRALEYTSAVAGTDDIVSVWIKANRARIIQVTIDEVTALVVD